MQFIPSSYRIGRDENSWYNKVADDAETASKAGNTAELYHSIRTLSGKTSAQLPPVVSKDGDQLNEPSEQLHRWKEHFVEQFNNTPPTPDILLQTEAANAVPNATVDTGPPNIR